MPGTFRLNFTIDAPPTGAIAVCSKDRIVLRLTCAVMSRLVVAVMGRCAGGVFMSFLSTTVSTLHHVTALGLGAVMMALGRVAHHQPVGVAHAESVGGIESHLNELGAGRHVAAVARGDGIFQGL